MDKFVKRLHNLILFHLFLFFFFLFVIFFFRVLLVLLLPDKAPREVSIDLDGIRRLFVLICISLQFINHEEVCNFLQRDLHFFKPIHLVDKSFNVFTKSFKVESCGLKGRK